MATTSYLIGLGSNRLHGRHGRPAQILAAAVVALAASGVAIASASPTNRSAAIGSDRAFANAVVLIATPLDPPALLTLLKRIEREFGRRRGRRWAARVLDLDILAWSGGAWPRRPRRASGALIVPHPLLGARGFALGPAATLAPHWRLPGDGRTLRQRDAARRKPHPVDRRHRHA